MNGTASIGTLLIQILITFIVLVCAFDYFDPFNAFHREADTLNFMVYKVYAPIAVSVITIIICLTVGLPLRLVPAAQNWWLSRAPLQLILLAAGLILLILSAYRGLQTKMTGIENGRLITWYSSNENLSMCGWFLTGFTVLHLYPAEIAAYISRKILGNSDWAE